MSIDKEKELILQKARRLFEMIEALDDTCLYRELAIKIRNDRDSQALISELVEMGKRIEDAVGRKDDSYKNTAEFDILQKKFELKTDVKEFLSAQKRYMNLLAVVKNTISECIDPSKS